jgi:hypothetical protein
MVMSAKAGLVDSAAPRATQAASRAALIVFSFATGT